MGRVLVGIGFVGGLVLLVWALARDPDRRGVELAAETSVPLVKTREPLVPAAVPGRVAEAEAVVPGIVPPAATPPRPQLETVRPWRGLAVVLDSEDIENSFENGFLELEPGGQVFQVENGAWTPGELTPESEVTIARAWLGGRLARPIEGALEIDHRRGVLTARLEWVDERPLLHVVARDTGQELEEVTLFTADGLVADYGARRFDVEFAQDWIPESLEATWRTAAGPSPVRLPIQRWTQPQLVYACAPGYAWGRIEVDPLTSREALLELEPSGELVVHVDTRGMSLPALRIERPGLRPLRLARLDRQAVVTVAHLPAGLYRIEAGSEPRSGTAEALVVPGRSVDATLILQRPRSELVEVSGELLVPKGSWPGNRWPGTWLSFGEAGGLEADELEIDDPEEELARWRMALPVDSRILAQAGFGATVVTFELDTATIQGDTVRLECPPPSIVEFRLFDVATGQPVHGRGKSWRRKWGGFPIRDDPASRIEYRLPLGESAVVDFQAEGYEPEYRWVRGEMELQVVVVPMWKME